MTEEEVMRLILDNFNALFMIRLNVLHPSLFRNAKEYMEVFYSKGGIVEANLQNTS